MDRTGIPDIDIEHAKYSSIMPVTNGKTAHCHLCRRIRRKYRVQNTKYPPKQGNTRNYPVFCQVWAKQSTSIGWYTCRFDSSLMTKDDRPIKQRRRKQEVRTLYYIHESINWSTVRQGRDDASAGAGQATRTVEADMRYAHGLWWNVRLTGGIVKLMTCGFSWKAMYSVCPCPSIRVRCSGGADDVSIHFLSVSPK